MSLLVATTLYLYKSTQRAVSHSFQNWFPTSQTRRRWFPFRFPATEESATLTSSKAFDKVLFIKRSNKICRIEKVIGSISIFWGTTINIYRVNIYRVTIQMVFLLFCILSRNTLCIRIDFKYTRIFIRKLVHKFYKFHYLTVIFWFPIPPQTSHAIGGELKRTVEIKARALWGEKGLLLKGETS